MGQKRKERRTGSHVVGGIVGFGHIQLSQGSRLFKPHYTFASPMV